MINLIPPSAESNVKREYWIRVVSVWMILIASAFVIVAVLNGPVYVMIRGQLNAYQSEYNAASIENEVFKVSEDALKQANMVGTLLLASQKTTSFSSIIAELEALTGEDVVITEYLLSRTDNKLGPIVIKGEARSRLVLSSFQEVLEESELFEKAELPLSNLAKDREIPFSITITPQITP